MLNKRRPIGRILSFIVAISLFSNILPPTVFAHSLESGLSSEQQQFASDGEDMPDDSEAASAATSGNVDIDTDDSTATSGNLGDDTEDDTQALFAADDPAATSGNVGTPGNLEEDGYALQLNWRVSDPNDITDWVHTPANTSSYTITYELKVIAYEAYDAQQMEIKIPANLFNRRDSNTKTLPSNYGVPKAPATSDSGAGFNYKLAGDSVVFTNFVPLKAGANLTIQVTYTIASPMYIKHDSMATLQAQGNAAGDERTSNAITYTIQTGVAIDAVTKSVDSKPLYYWDTKFGVKPDDFDDYKWISYRLSISGTATQPWQVTYTDTPGNDGIVHSFYYFAPTNGTGRGGLAEQTLDPATGAGTAKTRQSVDGNRSDIEAYESPLFVLVKYPAAGISEGTVITNNLKAEIIGVDGNSREEATTKRYYTWVDYKFNYTGALVALNKTNTQSDTSSSSDKVSGSLTLLKSSLDADMSNWSSVWHPFVTVYDYAEAHPGYSVELTDDFRDWLPQPGGTITQMTADDYYVKTVVVDLSVYKQSVTTGEKTFPGTGGYAPEYQLLALVGGASDYEVVRTGKISEIGTPNSAGGYNFVVYDLPENTVRIQFKLLGCEGYARASMRLYDVIKGDSPTLRDWADNSMPELSEVKIYNYAMARVHDSSGNLLNPVTKSSNYNSERLRERDIAEYNQQVQRATATKTLTGYIEYTDFTKSRSNPTDDAANQQIVFRYTLDAFEYYQDMPATASADLIRAGWEPPQRRSMTFYDLLPVGTFFDDRTPVVVNEPYGGPALQCDTTVETIDDYKGSGRQMVIFLVTMKDGATNWSTVKHSYMGTGARLFFNAVVPWQYMRYANNTVNLAAYQHDDGAMLAARDAQADNGLGSASSSNGSTSRQHFQAVTGDDGNFIMANLRNGQPATEKDTLYAYATQSFDAPVSMAEGLTKSVRPYTSNNLMGGFAEKTTVTPDTVYEYRLSLTSTENGILGNVILFDKLEQAGGPDGWRGEFDGLNLTWIERSGIAPVVYYSTAENPAYFTRDDVTSNTPKMADWTTTQPNDKSAITAVAVDVSHAKSGQPFTFLKGEGTDLIIRMKAPDKIPDALYAVNKGAYFSTFKVIGGNETPITNETDPTEVGMLAGALQITKTVAEDSGATADFSKEFDFTVTFTDADSNALSDSFRYSGDKTGTIQSGGTIQLKHGESVTFDRLAPATVYAVEESDYRADRYNTSVANGSDIIVANETAVAAFTNTKQPDPGPVDTEPGKLTVSKTVEGDAGSYTHEFDFTVTFTGADGNMLSGGFSYSGDKTGTIQNGETISLKHGESITFDDLAPATQYIVVEQNYLAAGYSMSSTESSGVIQSNKTTHAAFINTKNADPGPSEPPPVTPPSPPPPSGPREPGNKLVPGENGRYVELNENDVPVGEWHLDEDLTWIFDDLTPLGDLPRTGSAGLPFLLPLAGLMFVLLGFWVRGHRTGRGMS